METRAPVWGSAGHSWRLYTTEARRAGLLGGEVPKIIAVAGGSFGLL